MTTLPQDLALTIEERHLQRAIERATEDTNICLRCPIAEAGRERFPGHEVRVGFTHVDLGDDESYACTDPQLMDAFARAATTTALLTKAEEFAAYLPLTLHFKRNQQRKTKMKAERTHPQFNPVCLTLESQAEVDAIFVLLNHSGIRAAVGLTDKSLREVLLPYSDQLLANELSRKLACYCSYTS